MMFLHIHNHSYLLMPGCICRYSVLIQKDQNTLESLLRREDSVIILNVLTLLTKISRSSFNVSLLCSSSSMLFVSL